MSWSQEQFDEQWGPMVRTARSVLGSRDEAEECAAAAIVQVLERRPRDVDNVQAFMVTVAKRRAIDRHRTVERGRRRDARLETVSEASVADIAEGVVARAEAVWLDQEARMRLAPEVYGVLRMVADGVEVSEAAAAHGMTTRAAHSHLHRARKLLRGVWARTLAVIGTAWVAVRRSAGPSAVTALAAAAVITLPGWQRAAPQEPANPGLAVHLGSGGAGAAYVQSLPLSPSHARARTVVARSKISPKAATGSSSTVVEPLGNSTTISDERHGSGKPDGPVQGAVDCLQNFHLSTSQIGC